MGTFLRLVLLVLCQQVFSLPTDTENDLPPYLRGIGWRNVQKELEKDLRLDPSVRPISYDISLNVSVRGYGGAERSTFDGYVSITLNSTTARDVIEIHSAELILSNSTVEVRKIEYNRERETVVFTLPETLHHTDSAQLKVHYNGTAVMRGVGLFEYWTKPESPSDLPTISLVTNCEPVGARRWFPSFDEPDKKATFRVQVAHTSELTAYSNNAGETKEIGNGLNETTFHPTVPLPTYVVTLALTKQRVAENVYKGQKIRAIGSKWQNSMRLVNELKSSIDHVTSLAVFNNVTFIPEKTDWLVVEGSMSGAAMENPGLIVSGDYSGKSTQIHELAHMYFGNLVTLRSWEQIWINEGFANFFQSHGESGGVSARILKHISAHEAAIHEKFSYGTSQFLTSHFFRNGLVHYDKAGQLIRLIKRFIGAEAFDRALNRYLIENEFGNGDSEMMIQYLSADRKEAREILNAFVYQPGVALLTVDELNGQAIIEQRRFLRTDFIGELRDTKTRWTIPIYYKINGVELMEVMPRDVEKFVINIPANSSFSIDNSFPYLYAVYYPKRKPNRLSEIVAEAAIIDQKWTNERAVQVVPENPSREDNSKEKLAKFCAVNAQNKTKKDLMRAYLVESNMDYLMCDSDLDVKESAKRFIRDLILTNELPIRENHLHGIVKMMNEKHSGIFIEILSEDNEKISYLGTNVVVPIFNTAHHAEGGLDKIRNIVRENPVFGANFNHAIAKLLEEDFIKTEKAKRKLFFKKMNNSTDIVLKWEIDNPSVALAQGIVESEIWKEGGFEWQAVLKKNLPWAEFTVICGVNHSGPWTCNVEIGYSILKTNGSWRTYNAVQNLYQKSFSFSVRSGIEWWHLTSPEWHNVNNRITIKFPIKIRSCSGANPSDENPPIKSLDLSKFTSPVESGNVTLIIRDKQLIVSKEYLAIHSPVFSRMFYGDFIEKDKKEIETKEVEYDDFVNLLLLIFPNPVAISDYTVVSIASLADRYQMTGVSKSAENHLLQSGKFTTVQKLQLADDYRFVKLRARILLEACLQSFQGVQELKMIKDSQEFGSFSDNMLASICKRMMQLL